MKYIFSFLFFLFVSNAKAQSFKEISDSLLYHYQLQHFEQAIPFAEKAVTFVKANYGTDNVVYPKYLSMLAGMYVGTGQFLKAEPIFLETINIYKKTKADNTKDYINSISMLAIIYNMKGEDNKSIPLLAEVVEYYKKTVGESDPEYASAINKLAKVYDSQGQYEQAAELFIKSQEIVAKTKGINDPAYATVINNLGLVYKSMGQPEKAEPLLLQAMEIRKKAEGDSSTDYANSLNNLAVLYVSLGQIEKAVTYYNWAMLIFKKVKGPTSAEYITSLTNLGSTYERLSDYANAELFLLTAMKIAEKNYDEDWPLRLNITRNLGQLYLATEEYDKAGPYIQKVVAIEEKKNNNSSVYANVLNDLAFWYNHTNRIKEAEEAYRKSAAITKATLGPQHGDYAATLNNLAMLFLETGRYADAAPLLTEVTQIEVQNLLNLFTILSEAEKSAYIVNNIFLQHNNLSLLYSYPAAPASFYRENYNLQLLTKSLLLADTKNVLEYLRSSKDPAIKRLLSNWQTNKAALSKEYALSETKRRSGLKLLEQETEQLEKELIKTSSEFGNLQTNLAVKMEDIQKNLQQDEVAIEFVDFKLIEKNDSIRTIYAALVLKKNEATPVFVPLCDEKQLQRLIDSAGKSPTGRVKNFYRGFEIKNKASASMGSELYKLVWAPLEPYLKNIKKVSYSPAGKLYSIAFNALPADSSTLLIDKYNLVQYTSTRKVIGQKQENGMAKPKSIVLFGGANFSMDSLALVRKVKNKTVSGNTAVTTYKPQSKTKRGGIWVNLPGTTEEVKRIGDLFIQNRLIAKSFTKTNASEDNVKALSNQSPQVLHIATHGFFLSAPDDKKRSSSNVYSLADNPLLRSGLVLSGGNYAWSGKTPIEGIEDGIATAYEISQLNLSNTELVVLSACETALGDVKGSEGVFGLQRAFKMAGVKKMIVSLWQVPDKETAELMTSFYSYWIKGKTINEAFAQAQGDMRKKYSPFYWAAFVLVE